MVIFGTLVGFLAAVVQKLVEGKIALGKVKSVESVGDYVAKNKWSSTRQESSLRVLADRVDRRRGRGQVWAETLRPGRRTQ